MLCEFLFRSALQLADMERYGGIAAHVSPFTSVQDIGNLLNNTGFALLTLDNDEIIVGYPSLFELMWDLKGATNISMSFRLLIKFNVLRSQINDPF